MEKLLTSLQKRDLNHSKWIYLKIFPKTCPSKEFEKLFFSKINPFSMLENPLPSKNDPIGKNFMQIHQKNPSLWSKLGSFKAKTYSSSKSDFLEANTHIKTCLKLKSDLLRSIAYFKMCKQGKSDLFGSMTCFKMCKQSKSDLLEGNEHFKLHLTFWMQRHKNLPFDVMKSKRSTFDRLLM